MAVCFSCILSAASHILCLPAIFLAPEVKGAVGFGDRCRLPFNAEAVIITYTVLGAPYFN